MKINYSYSLERLNRIIYNLLIHEETSKKRLIHALSNTTVHFEDFPAHLQSDWEKIEKITVSRPKCEYNNAYYNSLINRRNKTCSVVIKDIYAIKLKLEKHLKVTND